MKTKHVLALFFGGLCLVWFVWALLDWGKPAAEFDRTVSEAAMTRLLTDGGLEVCEKRTIELDATPGLVKAKSLDLSRRCKTDKNPMTISLLEFESEEARDGAQQRISGTHRGGFGPHLAYAYGPYVLTVQGTRGIGDQLLLGKILSEVER